CDPAAPAHRHVARTQRFRHPDPPDQRVAHSRMTSRAGKDARTAYGFGRPTNCRESSGRGETPLRGSGDYLTDEQAIPGDAGNMAARWRPAELPLDQRQGVVTRTVARLAKSQQLMASSDAQVQRCISIRRSAVSRFRPSAFSYQDV